MCRLSTLIQGRSDRETVAANGLAWEQIAAHREGLVCLSGGCMGWVDRFLRSGELSSHAGVRRPPGRHVRRRRLPCAGAAPAGGRGICGRDRRPGRRLGMPMVAVQPVYCLPEADTPRLRLLAAIRANRPLGAVYEEEEDAEAAGAPAGGDAAGGDAGAASAAWTTAPIQQGSSRAVPEDTGRARVDVHWLSPGEMTARFKDYAQALDHTGEVAGRCGNALPDGRPIWPSLTLPNGQSPADALAELAHGGLLLRFPTDPPAARLEKELAAISHHGFAPLFLVVADIVRFARDHGVPVSTRGSVANSLVAYCTGITTVDPIEHDLLFERFLNPARRQSTRHRPGFLLSASRRGPALRARALRPGSCRTCLHDQHHAPAICGARSGEGVRPAR